MQDSRALKARLRLAGYSEIDIEHVLELRRLIAERDAKYPMPTWITQAEMNQRKRLRLSCDGFEVFEPKRLFRKETHAGYKRVSRPAE